MKNIRAGPPDGAGRVSKVYSKILKININYQYQISESKWLAQGITPALLSWCNSFNKPITL